MSVAVMEVALAGAQRELDHRLWISHTAFFKLGILQISAFIANCKKLCERNLLMTRGESARESEIIANQRANASTSIDEINSNSNTHSKGRT